MPETDRPERPPIGDPDPYPVSARVLADNRRYIPGGVVSLNRAVEPNIAFTRAKGSHLWDEDGNRYVDLHAAFAPMILGHNHPAVTAAVEGVLAEGRSLYGAGPNRLEGELARRIVELVPSIDAVQLTNSGSEATYHALRIARAHTGRTDVVVMQGGYNGWHNDVAVNVMNDLDDVGHRISPGEYPVRHLSAGVPPVHRRRSHVVNFNDLASVEYVLRRHPVAAVMTEPVLQNVGVIKPRPGYLAGLRDLCDRYGVVFILDEVKTGFRHGAGGYQAKAGVKPDLTILGKAVANGYPLAVIGGAWEYMEHFMAEDPSRRVMIAGTYNAHPVPVSAALATLMQLTADDGAAYRQLDDMTQRLCEGLTRLFEQAGLAAVVARESSAFCLYFMDHEPRDWHDIRKHHDFELDRGYRQALIKRGVYHFPVPTKQGSISTAHSAQDVQAVLDATEAFLAEEGGAG